MGHIDVSRRFTIEGIVGGLENNAPWESVFVTSLKGWDEFNIEYVTVPKLYGNGSYIVEENIPQREVIVEFTVADRAHYFPNLLRSLESAAISKQPRTVTRVIGDRSESLTMRITGVSEVNQMRDDMGVVQVTLLAVNPIKTIT